ncbi:fumarylacetoacetate hydrolase family protein [Nocardia sp. NPDC059239]|uniref:fumarylacetoacetate hydrolase family protein n=1 Tax=unclassified Nocardia TaxID=2637762 RepID=UPI0036A8D52C
MRYITYVHPTDGERVAVLEDNNAFALEPGLRLIDLLGDDGERLHEAGRRALADPRQVRAVSEVTLRSPIPQPPTVRDYMTFESHLEGVMKLTDPRAAIPAEWYHAPAFYFTNPYAVIGPADPVPIAPGSHAFDLELEVAAGTWVKPGDVLGSGTCGGGCLAELWGRKGRDAHPALAPGDSVTVTVDRLGSLTTRIAADSEVAG